MNFVWLGLTVVFFIVEGATVGLVSTWFALGALAAMVISLLGGELWLQILVFVTVSTVTLAMLRPLAKKRLCKASPHPCQFP